MCVSGWKRVKKGTRLGDQGCWVSLRQLWYQPISVLACEEIVEWLLESG